MVMATSSSSLTLISNYHSKPQTYYISSFPRNPNPPSLSPKFQLHVSSSDEQETRWLREEKRWLREETRWLREESRWLREESRWISERDSLLREISDLKHEIDALENQKPVQQMLNDVESGSNVGLIAENASNINAMSLEKTKLKEDEMVAAMLVKDIIVTERVGEELRSMQVGKSKTSNVFRIKCSACRGEGRLLCMECDGTGLPNIEEQFMEWIEEGAKCPYCEGLGYTICDACER